MVTGLEALVILVVLAFAPSLVWALLLRNSERSRREPFVALAQAFGSGAVIGIVVAMSLEAYILPRLPPTGLPATYVLAVVVAPLVEEAAKPLGLFAVRDHDPEPEDGYIYGAAAGLGFAATENLIYEAAALATGGLAAFALTFLVRSTASALLHASATSFTGYGVWAARFGRRSWLAVIPLFALAVAAHAAFNHLAATSTLASLAVAILLAAFAWRHVRRRVRSLDARAPSA